MSKIKIKELSDQMSLEVKEILSKCKELSIIARTQSSAISLDDAKKIQIALVGEPILNKPKDENDIIKRSGSKVTIRRKKKEPPIKTEEIKKTETQVKDSKAKTLDSENVLNKNKDDSSTLKENLATKTQVVETSNRKVIRTLDNTSEPSKKPKTNNKHENVETQDNIIYDNIRKDKIGYDKHIRKNHLK